MAYLPTIPQANQYQDATQPMIQENFTQLNTQFAIDHIAFDAASNNGKHNQVTFVDRGLTPPAPTGNQLLLYNNGGLLFINNSSGDNIGVMSATISPLNGFYNLWSGHRVRIGKVTATGTAGSLTTVAWPTAWSGVPSSVMLTIDASMTTDVDVYWDQATTTTAVLGVRLIGANSITFWFNALGPI